MLNVGKSMSFLPPMIGDGKHTTYKRGDEVYGMVLPILNEH